VSNESYLSSCCCALDYRCTNARCRAVILCANTQGTPYACVCNVINCLQHAVLAKPVQLHRCMSLISALLEGTCMLCICFGNVCPVLMVMFACLQLHTSGCCTAVGTASLHMSGNTQSNAWQTMCDTLHISDNVLLQDNSHTIDAMMTQANLRDGELEEGRPRRIK